MMMIDASAAPPPRNPQPAGTALTSASGAGVAAVAAAPNPIHAGAAEVAEAANESAGSAAGGAAKRKQANYRGPKTHSADKKLRGIFSTEQLRMAKPEWQKLLAVHSATLTDEEVTRLKQLRRRSKCCV